MVLRREWLLGICAAALSHMVGCGAPESESLGEWRSALSICDETVPADRTMDGIPAYTQCSASQTGAIYSNNGVDTRTTSGGTGWVRTQYSGGYQCTELAHRYLVFRWNVNWIPNGNAGVWCDTVPPSNSGLVQTTEPVHGDLIVFAPGSCGADLTTGHVALVDTVGASQLMMLQQNRASRLSVKPSCAKCFLHVLANDGSGETATGGGAQGSGGSADPGSGGLGGSTRSGGTEGTGGAGMGGAGMGGVSTGGAGTAGGTRSGGASERGAGGALGGTGGALGEARAGTGGAVGSGATSDESAAVSAKGGALSSGATRAEGTGGASNVDAPLGGAGEEGSRLASGSGSGDNAGSASVSHGAGGANGRGVQPIGDAGEPSSAAAGHAAMLVRRPPSVDAGATCFCRTAGTSRSNPLAVWVALFGGAAYLGRRRSARSRRGAR